MILNHAILEFPTNLLLLIDYHSADDNRNDEWTTGATEIGVGARMGYSKLEFLEEIEPMMEA